MVRVWAKGAEVVCGFARPGRLRRARPPLRDLIVAIGERHPSVRDSRGGGGRSAGAFPNWKLLAVSGGVLFSVESLRLVALGVPGTCVLSLATTLLLFLQRLQVFAGVWIVVTVLLRLRLFVIVCSVST
jgi:hypothetical protein